jgi:hypothetical protein
MKIFVICGLAVCFEFINSCASTLTEDELYERADAYNRLVEDYETQVTRCRQTHGSMVSAGSWSRKITGELTVDQMSSARCVQH